MGFNAWMKAKEAQDLSSPAEVPKRCDVPWRSHQLQKKAWRACNVTVCHIMQWHDGAYWKFGIAAPALLGLTAAKK